MKMASEYRQGFKKAAEEPALAVRREMGLNWDDPLHPRRLVAHVGVPVFDLNELTSVGMPQESLHHLLGKGSGEFSAALFERNGMRLIIANPVHSTGRQASNIVHEVAHLLLRHEPPTEILQAGCRRWNAEMEREADWLAGGLLVPRRVALSIARRRLDVRQSALWFGVSEAMMRWRLNHSGARKQAERERARRRTRG